ncbi:MAG TPA: hemerythrin domain-containing protein [Candidatus Salinicoccus stercoripullorum]|uniref:Hemerythrin domain-containing protein n=1 Tax=Candidatus Salinicoccus stercoripullorum TaxID=2838756 RepID=A0A9D1U1W9_9STAP|nr:hemerythrin domain-containing protein [Candidatus Salinicoccus stercoripullorum]
METFNFKMKALRVLENEHRLIMHEITSWFDRMRELEERGQYGTAEMEALMDKIAVSKEIINRHQLKEDRYFFEMLGHYIGMDQGPIMAIQEEHSEIEQYFTNAFVMHGEGRSLAEFSPYLQEAYEILYMHMYKEENVLFPMAEKQFRTIDEEKLLEQLNSNILEET